MNSPNEADIVSETQGTKEAEKQITKKSTRKRRKKHNDAQNRYDGITVSPIESSGRPGTPHRFFSSSYNVTIDHSVATSSTKETEKHAATETNSSINNELNTKEEGQVVHRHANGLAIVTAGAAINNALKHISETSSKVAQITDFRFKLQISNCQSVGGKRKRARKMTGSGNAPGVVKPKDVLAVVEFSNGSEIELKCCIGGTLLELNENIVRKEANGQEEKNFSLLMDDPLLDGYLAVIMPSGFPQIKDSGEK